MQDGSLGLLHRVMETLMDSVAHCHSICIIRVEAITYTQADIVLGGERWVRRSLGLFMYIGLGLLS